MKRLQNYIQRAIQNQQYTLTDIEERINEFIFLNYRNITPRRYCQVVEKECLCFRVSIDPRFEEELSIHYPEKLI